MDAFDRCNAKLDLILERLSSTGGLADEIRRSFHATILTQRIIGLLLAAAIFAAPIIAIKLHY